MRFHLLLAALTLAPMSVRGVEILPAERTGGVPVVRSGTSERIIEVGGATEKFIVNPGDRLRFLAGSQKGRMLTLTDASCGAVWYRGKAGEMDLRCLALRTRHLELEAVFTDESGRAERRQKIVLDFDDAAESLYPGVLAQVIRCRADTPPLPPAEAFAPPAGTTFPRLDADYADYPPFRTAESVRPVDRGDPDKPGWSPPSYFHNVVPSFDLAASEKTIADWNAPCRFPLGDPEWNGKKKTASKSGAERVCIRLSAGLPAETAGFYEFRVESAAPARLEVAGRSATSTAAAGPSLRVELSPGIVPVAVTVDALPEVSSLEFRLLWKPPGATTFVPVPASLPVHRVSRVRERALAKFTDGFAYRNLTTTGARNDKAAAALLSDFDPAKHVETFESFDAALKTLTGAFSGRGELRGAIAPARAALGLVRECMHFLLTHRDALSRGGFGKTDGRRMRSYEAMRAFLAVCERNPALQSEALATRAALAGYATGTCLSRSFFGESHSGTNDGYGDDDNLLVNFWRAAACLDDPFAWDAATCLMDNHFRYGPGVAESLGSDGLFQFHNVNGRSVQYAYAHDWVHRVTHAKRLGTPWGYTPEQYRRLGAFLLAEEWLFYRGTLSFQVNGRHNVHTGNPDDLARLARKLLDLPGPALPETMRGELTDMERRIRTSRENTIQGTRFFYRNLFMVHRRGDFYIDVKMTSPGVAGPETFAGAFPWNMSFGDGVTTLMRDGGEYAAIHRNAPNSAYLSLSKSSERRAGQVSLWHYRSLPGTTQFDDELHKPDRYRTGSGEAAGGVSDGMSGSCGFSFDNPRTGSAFERFYAFTGDGMLVLTAGIRATRPEKGMPAGVTLRSNINQCDRRTEVKVTAQDGTTTRYAADAPDGVFRFPLTQRYFVEHDGICYLVMPTGDEGGAGKPGTLELELSERSTTSPYPGWSVPPAVVAKLDGMPEGLRKARVFHLSIDHGRTVQNGRAAWFVCMTGGSAHAAEWLERPPVAILANTPGLQAAGDRRDGVTNAFFRTPGELRSPDGAPMFSTAEPAAVMWNPETRALTAADPRAACIRGNAVGMADSLRIMLGTGLPGVSKPIAETLPMPGAKDPDDRYRGAPATRRIP